MRRWLLLAIVVATLAVAGVWLAFRLQSHRPATREAAPRWPLTVSTIAGGGFPGFTRGYASDALFSDPFGVAVDGSGRVYVSDAGSNNAIRCIQPTGEVTLIAGGVEGWLDGIGPLAAFNSPSGLALAPDGALIVADTGNNAIRRVAPDGTVTTLAGGLGSGRSDGRGVDARLAGPIGVTVRSDGSIFVADSYNDCIRRVSPDGLVTTVAGGTATGYRDGPAGEALFDTPSGIAVDREGRLYVADTGNNAVRRIETDGTVSTIEAAIAPTEPDAGSPALTQPIGIAVSPANEVYVADAAGRVVLISPGGGARVIAGTTPGFADGPAAAARLGALAGVALDAKGTLYVADSDNFLVRALTPPRVPLPAHDVFLSPLPALSPATLGSSLPWPIAPQDAWHEVTATLGEARGSFGGDGRERLHAGIDVFGRPGEVARAVRSEKVQRPIAATGYGTLNETLHVGLAAYVHVRVGRTARDFAFDDGRFAILPDEFGVPMRVRVRRGTRFQVGDPIGTVNRFSHVHLGLGPRFGEVNALRFSLPGFADHVPPTIPPGGITLTDEAGTPLAATRKRVIVSGRVAIVVSAWDRVDRNLPRRKLGVYSLGYQVLAPDGTPVPGFEEPLVTIVFDRLPETPGAPSIVYAEGSGIRAYTNHATSFRYIVTDRVRNGEARKDWWDTTTLPPGDYVLRVVAADVAGNSTTRTLRVTVVR